MDKKTNKYRSSLKKLNILYQISRYVSSTLDLEKVLRTILAGVTLGDGFGFDRAYLFLADKRHGLLIGRMAQEADIHGRGTLEGFMKQKEGGPQGRTSLDPKVKSINIPLDSNTLVAESFRENKVLNVGLEGGMFEGTAVEPQIIEMIGHPRFCVIPLASFGRALGVMIVDNKFSQREITSDDVDFLLMLSQQATLAIENANAYLDLKTIINRLVKINQKINNLKEYNENILENIPIGICVVDTGYIINACNSSFCRMAKKEKDDLMGSNISKIGLRVKGYNIKRLLRKVLKIKKNRSFESVEYGFAKEAKVCNLNLALFEVNSNIDGIIIIIDDITEKTRMEETLRDFKRLAQLGELAAHVAHEIRNPLVSIGGYTRRLKKKYEQGQKMEIGYLNIIIQEVERLEDILRETLQFSGKKEPIHKEIDLIMVIRECVRIVSSYAEDKSVGLLLDIDRPQDTLFINGSRQQLKQAFINIIKNSIEASQGGEEVKVSLGRTKGTAAINIENKGLIVEPKDIEKIFLPFYSTKEDGTGLGLAITKKIILDHNGKIGVNSEKGNTIFTITLPIGGSYEKNTGS